jgi:SAM-dependent methyltransferase
MNAWLRWDVVERVLPSPDPSLRALEVGCGQGGFGARLAQRYAYLGVDADAPAAGIARQRVLRVSAAAQVLTGALADVVPADPVYDLVCAFEVLEHIEDDENALRSWIERLRPGGRLLISTPADARRLGAWDELVGHYRRYDLDGMADDLRRVGLVDVRVVGFGAPLGYLLETGRNVVAQRRAGAADRSMFERTTSSGRTLQPSRRASGAVMRVASLPFRRIQRVFPRKGTGLVATAVKPPG